MKVHKLMKDATSSHAHDSLVNIITKTSILCLVSTLCTFLFLSLFTFRGVASESLFYNLSAAVLCIADIYTNYLSVLLSFKRFDAWYRRLCGCCDAKCHLFWNHCLNSIEKL